MQQTVAVHGGRLRLKTLTLNELPEEAWISLRGGSTAPGNVHDLYKSVPWLFAAVNIIAHAVASLPVRATRDGKEVDDPPAMLPFLREFGQVRNEMAGDLLLFGAAYALVYRKGGYVTRVRRLHPASITPNYDNESGLLGFSRRVGSTQTTYATREMAYCWVPNRESECGPGVPPAAASLVAAGILANVDQAASNIFRNGAILPTIAVVADMLPDAQVLELKSRIQRLVAGVKNAFSIPVISRDIEFKTVGEYPDRLAMPELTDKKREDIATALGIPQTLLFSQAANYATAEQEAYQFYDTTVLPYAQSLLDSLNPYFAPWKLETAENELELYQGVETDRVTALVALKAAGAITIDEVRQRAGFPELTEEQRAELEGEEPEPEPDPPPPDPSGTTDNAPVEASAVEVPADTPSAEARRMVKELGQWERFVLKRLGREGARKFETSDALHPTFAAAVAGALETATTPDEVREVFRHVVDGLEYP